MQLFGLLLDLASVEGELLKPREEGAGIGKLDAAQFEVGKVVGR